MFSVIQIAQRWFRLSTTSCPVCGSLEETLAIQIAQREPQLLATFISGILVGKQVVHLFLWRNDQASLTLLVSPVLICDCKDFCAPSILSSLAWVQKKCDQPVPATMLLPWPCCSLSWCSPALERCKPKKALSPLWLILGGLFNHSSRRVTYILLQSGWFLYHDFFSVNEQYDHVSSHPLLCSWMGLDESSRMWEGFWKCKNYSFSAR